MKYLDFYKNWLQKGEIPGAGLCSCIPSDDMDIFDDEVFRWPLYWGYGENNYWQIPRYKVSRDFTPLRQNMILFLAAMAGEKFPEYKTKRK